jgi:hypothetical protein
LVPQAVRFCPPNKTTLFAPAAEIGRLIGGVDLLYYNILFYARIKVFKLFSGI